MSEGLKAGAPVRHHDLRNWKQTWSDFCEYHANRTKRLPEMSANRAALPKPPHYAGPRPR